VHITFIQVRRGKNRKGIEKRLKDKMCKACDSPGAGGIKERGRVTAL